MQAFYVPDGGFSRLESPCMRIPVESFLDQRIVAWILQWQRLREIAQKMARKVVRKQPQHWRCCLVGGNNVRRARNSLRLCVRLIPKPPLLRMSFPSPVTADKIIGGLKTTHRNFSQIVKVCLFARQFACVCKKIKK